MSRFQIQSWEAAEHCTCGVEWNASVRGHRTGCPYPRTTRSWVPMENGPAKSTWKPRRTAQEAVARAAEWSGAVWGLGIPAMQVVELATGTVVWRSSAHYPDAGEPVEPHWMDAVYRQVQTRVRAERDAGAEPEPEPVQDTLW